MTANDSEVVEEQGASDKPSQEVSQPETSPSTVDVSAIADTLLPALEKEVEKRFQSYKDKRFDQITTQVSDMQNILTKYNQLIEGGKSPEEAQERLELDRRLEILEQQLEGQVPQAQPAGQSDAPVASVGTQAILKALGLQENNPEVTRILRDTNDVAAQTVEFVALSKTQVAPDPNPAAVQPSAGGESVNQSAEAIAEQLSEAQKDPVRNRAQIKTLTEALDKVVTKQ